WSDVGSFAALPEVRPADADGNVVVGKGTGLVDSAGGGGGGGGGPLGGGGVLVDGAGGVVVGSGRPLGLVGLRDMVVVDAGDAVLVVPRERSQDVRSVVQSLRARGLGKFE